MIEAADYRTLELLFGRSGSLPPLPAAALRLISLIDYGEPSVIDLERIIASDPALSADFLRISHAKPGVDEDAVCTTLRNCIVRLGQKAVRSMAVSLLVQSLMRQRDTECLFDNRRYNQHSLFVGFMAKYIYSRRELTQAKSSLTADEVFALAVLHDISIALLAKVAPNVYNRVHLYAQRMNLSIADGFQRLYGRSVHGLGAIACQQWMLPDAFGRCLASLEEPWIEAELSDAVCSINMADRIAERYEWTLNDWSSHAPILPEVQAEAWVPDEELVIAVPRVMEVTLQHIPTNQIAMEIPPDFASSEGIEQREHGSNTTDGPGNNPTVKQFQLS